MNAPAANPATAPATPPATAPATVPDEEDGLPTWWCEAGGELLPGLRAVERLGVGHRAETWLAWSLELWHPVVVKLARPHQVDHPRARATLAREARALGEPGHPALPRLLHAVLDGPGPGAGGTPAHVVMEHVDGEPLSDLVDDHGAADPAEVAMLGARLLPPLLHLHRRGLVHLDVKSENVLVSHGRPVLLDCGSTRETGRPQPAGRPLGTFGYAAPELEACRPLAPAMDLYGLGTVLAEALTGVAFPDLGGPEALPDSPVTAVVRRLLAPDPADRGTPASLLADLARACAEPPWPAGIALPGARTAGPASPGTTGFAAPRALR